MSLRASVLPKAHAFSKGITQDIGPEVQVADCRLDLLISCALPRQHIHFAGCERWGMAGPCHCCVVASRRRKSAGLTYPEGIVILV